MRRKLTNLLLTWLLSWVLNAAALLVVSHLVPGFYITSTDPGFHLRNIFEAALAASLVIGILNVTLGWLLKIITLPISSLTFGVFLLVINAGMFLLASRLVPDFKVESTLSAFLAALELTLLQMLYRTLKKTPAQNIENASTESIKLESRNRD